MTDNIKDGIELAEIAKRHAGMTPAELHEENEILNAKIAETRIDRKRINVESSKIGNLSPSEIPVTPQVVEYNEEDLKRKSFP